MSLAPRLVLAVGNPARGDDGAGPWLAERLRALALPGLEVLEDYQLQVEHALDLAGREAVLFIDAAHPGGIGGVPASVRPEPVEGLVVRQGFDKLSPNGGGFDKLSPNGGGIDKLSPNGGGLRAGLALWPLQPAQALPALSHALTPAGVLHVAQRLGQPLPRCWMLAVQGECFGLGEGFSAAMSARLPQALERAQAWAILPA